MFLCAVTRPVCWEESSSDSSHFDILPLVYFSCVSPFVGSFLRSPSHIISYLLAWYSSPPTSQYSLISFESKSSSGIVFLELHYWDFVLRCFSRRLLDSVLDLPSFSSSFQSLCEACVSSFVGTLLEKPEWRLQLKLFLFFSRILILMLFLIIYLFVFLIFL